MTVLFIAEPTGFVRLELRRFCSPRTNAWNVCQDLGYHNATALIATIPATRCVRDDNGLLLDPACPEIDDPRWPEKCAGCDYLFKPDDPYQQNDREEYRAPDGTLFTVHDIVHGKAPVGAMVRAPWMDRPEQEGWLVAIPGGSWITTQPSMSGQGWVVTGNPPRITVSPSIHHHPPDGWHGWIREGRIEL